MFQGHSLSFCITFIKQQLSTCKLKQTHIWVYFYDTYSSFIHFNSGKIHAWQFFSEKNCFISTSSTYWNISRVSTADLITTKTLDKNCSNNYEKVSLAVTVFTVPYNYWTLGYEPVCPELWEAFRLTNLAFTANISTKHGYGEEGEGRLE